MAWTLRSIAGLLALAGVTVFADLSAAAKPRVTSVTPAAAVPGAVVDVAGRGLPGKAASVRVAGKRARVLTGTTRRLRVVVPRVSAGRRVLTVRGRRGRTKARLRILRPFDGTIAVRGDARRAARATIGPDGGTVTTRAADGTVFTLRLPAGAVAAPTAITITPATRVTGLPLTGSFTAAAQFAPNGLQLAKPGALEITLPARARARRLVGFAYNGAGSAVAFARATRAGRMLTVQVEHFSGGGISAAQAADFANAVQPIVNQLGFLTPNQVETLLDIVAVWMEMFGPGFCGSQPVCGLAIQKGSDSLTHHIGQRCAAGALTPSLRVIRETLGLAAQRQRLGLDTSVPITCVRTIFAPIITPAGPAAMEDALADAGVNDLEFPSDGARTGADVDSDTAISRWEWLWYLAAQAQVVGFQDLAGPAIDNVLGALEQLLGRARTRCETDAAGGMAMLTRGKIYADRTVVWLPEFVQALSLCPVRITIAPAATELQPGQQAQFSAPVTGHDNQAVNWMASGGQITANGNFTAPAAPGTYTVTATSQANPQRTATATVTVTQAAVAGTYHGTHKDYDWGECTNPCDDRPASAVVETNGNSFTLYYFPRATVGDTTTCGVETSSCIKVTGTRSSGALTGTGVRDPDAPKYRDLPFDASHSGTSLNGTLAWELDCPDGCYYDFNLARDP